MINESPEKKINILFFSAVDLINGRGTEKTISEFILNAPIDKFEIYLLDSDAMSTKNLDEELLRNINDRANKFKFCNNDSKFEFAKKNTFLFIIYEVLLRPINLYYQRLLKQRKLIKTIKNYSIDIVYMGFNEYLPFLRGLHTKIILSTHTMPTKYPTLTKILLKLASHSLYYRGIVGIHYFPSFKPFIKNSPKLFNICLPNGTSTEKFKPVDNSTKNLQILFVGSIEKEKGILDFLSVFYLLKDTNIDFHIVGYGSLSEEIRTISKNYANLHYHGFIEQTKIGKIYSDSDIFLYPTKHDSFALVVLDALSSGLYVFTSYLLKGTYDDFQKLGYLEYSSFKDYNTIASKIRKMNENKVNLRKLRSNIHEYTAKNYDWKEISNTLYRYFEEVMYIK